MRECQQSEPDSRENRPRLLIVDDDIVVPLWLRRIFESSYDLVTASDGEEGLRAFAMWRPDLVILDVSLPGLDGWEVLRRIREAGDTPVMMLTAHEAPDDVVRGFEAGADDYVTKPYTAEIIRARVHALLRRAQTQENRAGSTDTGETSRVEIDGGRLVFDLTRAIVHRDGRLLDLSKTEYRILALLARRRDHVVRQAEILTEVWGEDRVADVNSVKSYIRLLRRKVEPDPSTPRYIVTRHRAGYMLLSSPLS